ncbi:cysteine hydrolase family protein [Pseudonocardia sp.]|uniref:cysteine hydrolase family protein n=1 Tax=Pseudonocardia sp. TaxID=60912 RepID=UPI003D0A7FAA
MTTYDPEHTAILLIDPYNDFLSEGGKLWPLLKEAAEEIDLIENLRLVVGGAREAGIRVVWVPHRRWREGDYDGWRFLSPAQVNNSRSHFFAADTWGGDWHPDFVPSPGDIVAKEHWAQSGFPNTDLEFLLKQHGITHVISVGLLANTCVESTSRFAMELGYHVTLVSDATVAIKPGAWRAANEINGPTYAHSILSSDELVKTLQAAGLDAMDVS